MTKHHDPKDLRLHHEIMKGADTETDSHLHHHWHTHKEWYKAILAILLTILMVSFTFAAFPVGDKLASLAISQKISPQAILTFDEHDIQGTIIFQNNIATELQEKYTQNEGRENAFCLQGTITSQKDKRTYTIDSYYVPIINHASFGNVHFQSCDQDTIINMHTHPRGSCKASQTDLSTLASIQKKYPQTIMLIQCAEKRFTIQI